MKLIDADAENERLLDFIAQNDSGIKYAIEHKDMTMLEDIFFDYFNSQTTAYDVDKVVERFVCESINCHIMTDRAVEIIKSGGIE